MALMIRERTGQDWCMVRLVPATLDRDIWSTVTHGQTGQELVDGWLDAGTTVYVRPEDVGHRTHRYVTHDELPAARDAIYDEHGMLHRIRHADWSALSIENA